MKQKTKRILGVRHGRCLRIVNLRNLSPYTVMATEAGETIAPLAEEGSGSEVATPGTETGTPGESGEGGTVAPSGEPEGPTTPSAPEVPKPTPKTYLKVICDAGLIEDVRVGQISLKFAGLENVMRVNLNENNIIEDGLTVESCASDNYNVTYSEKQRQKMQIPIGRFTLPG